MSTEHPAVALLREMCADDGMCPRCGLGENEGHAYGCEVAAILNEQLAALGAKPLPNERHSEALRSMLADERAKGAEEEREACAQIADDQAVETEGGQRVADAIAAAIRARGQR